MGTRKGGVLMDYESEKEKEKKKGEEIFTFESP